MLLLRAVLGLAVLAQGGYYLSDSDFEPAIWVPGLAGILASGLLLIGFLTPLAGVMIALAGGLVSFLPTATRMVFDSRLTIIFGATILLTVIVLGPGAFSLDARLFGRREIIIPPPVIPTRR